MTWREQVLSTSRWAPSFAWQAAVRSRRRGPVHLILAIADHFEPSFNAQDPSTHVPLDEQERRLERWLEAYPLASGQVRDADGRVLRHTIFFPAEQYQAVLLGRLSAFCRAGWGEVEVHLHHGVREPDSAENTERALSAFRDTLVRYGLLSRWEGRGTARYAFVHGNWALANSRGGKCCGVDSELAILARTGCFADLTLPSAPTEAQVAIINGVYECALPLQQRAAHRRGVRLTVGHPPSVFPLMIQGPLAMYFTRRGLRTVMPRIDNAELSQTLSFSRARYHRWRKYGAVVAGRPDWVFVKVHCHGMDPKDRDIMVGDARRRLLAALVAEAGRWGDRLHFVTAREMTNILLAACDGRDGSPDEYRDYKLQLVSPSDGG